MCKKSLHKLTPHWHCLYKCLLLNLAKNAKNRKPVLVPLEKYNMQHTLYRFYPREKKELAEKINSLGKLTNPPLFLSRYLTKPRRLTDFCRLWLFGGGGSELDFKLQVSFNTMSCSKCWIVIADIDGSKFLNDMKWSA